MIHRTAQNRLVGSLKIANLFIWAILFFNSVNEYPALFNDFRNRVVGARLMKDGLNPYFYIWKKGDPIRYYDTGIDPAGFLSVSTATPFFHWIFSPVCDLPQYQLNLLWFFVQWLSVAVSVLIAASFISDRTRKQVLFLVAAALMWSLGFRQHFFQMQLYLPVSALLLSGIYFWKNKSGLWCQLIAAACFETLILIRPTFILLVAPMFFYKPIQKLIIYMGILLFCYGVFAIVNNQQRYNWQQFYVSIQYRMGKLPMPAYKPVPFNWYTYTAVEGVQVDNEKSQLIAHRLLDGNAENSNFHFMYEAIAGKFPSSKWLFICQLLSIAAGACLIVFFAGKKNSLYWYDLLVIGFIVYWFVEFFSPVSSKLLYYFVLFLYPVLLYFSLVPRLKWLPTSLLLGGIFFNIFKFEFLKMNCTFGQGMIMLGLLIEMWMRRKRQQAIS